MRDAGATTDQADRFLDELRSGADICDALVAAGAPHEAARFVESTFLTIETEKPHIIAAAFTFGREDLIPDMFRSIVADLNRTFPGRLGTLIYYLERHIDVDGDSHGPMALRMIADLCCDDEKRWEEAAHAAARALEARLALWTAIHNRIRRDRNLGTAPPHRENPISVPVMEP